MPSTASYTEIIFNTWRSISLYFLGCASCRFPSAWTLMDIIKMLIRPVYDALGAAFESLLVPLPTLTILVKSCRRLQ